MRGGTAILAQATEADFAELATSAMTVFVFSLLSFALLLLLLFALGWWWTHRDGSRSPYGGGPLRRGEELTFNAVSAMETFFLDLDPLVNPGIDPRQAAVCEMTGRVFPQAQNGSGVMCVTWGFLRRFEAGPLVSWGSLSPMQQKYIRSLHRNWQGFQFDHSSPSPRPDEVEREYMMRKPGPLYVNPQTGVLVGWQSVPNTDLEVMVVQKPQKKP